MAFEIGSPELETLRKLYVEGFRNVENDVNRDEEFAMFLNRFESNDNRGFDDEAKRLVISDDNMDELRTAYQNFKGKFIGENKSINHQDTLAALIQLQIMAYPDMEHEIGKGPYLNLSYSVEKTYLEGLKTEEENSDNPNNDTINSLNFKIDVIDNLFFDLDYLDDAEDKDRKEAIKQRVEYKKQFKIPLTDKEILEHSRIVAEGNNARVVVLEGLTPNELANIDDNNTLENAIRNKNNLVAFNANTTYIIPHKFKATLPDGTNTDPVENGVIFIKTNTNDGGINSVTGVSPSGIDGICSEDMKEMLGRFGVENITISERRKENNISTSGHDVVDSVKEVLDASGQANKLYKNKNVKYRIEQREDANANIVRVFSLDGKSNKFFQFEKASDAKKYKEANDGLEKFFDNVDYQAIKSSSNIPRAFLGKSVISLFKFAGAYTKGQLKRRKQLYNELREVNELRGEERKAKIQALMESKSFKPYLARDTKELEKHKKPNGLYETKAEYIVRMAGYVAAKDEFERGIGKRPKYVEIDFEGREEYLKRLENKKRGGAYKLKNILSPRDKSIKRLNISTLSASRSVREAESFFYAPVMIENGKEVCLKIPIKGNKVDLGDNRINQMMLVSVNPKKKSGDKGRYNAIENPAKLAPASYKMMKYYRMFENGLPVHINGMDDDATIFDICERAKVAREQMAAQKQAVQAEQARNVIL